MESRFVKFFDTHEEVVKCVKKLSKEALRAGGKVAMKRIRSSTPVATGKARKLVGQWARVDTKSGQPRLDIGYYSKGRAKKKGIVLPTNYIALMDQGTKAHEIVPGIRSYRRNGGPLRIRKVTGKQLLSDGTRVYGRRVRHPGARPRSVLENEVRNNLGAIRAAMEPKLAELNKTLDQLRGIDGGEAIDDA